MARAKKTDEKNSLEQLLLRWKKAFEENKKQAYQYILLAVLLILVVVVVRMKFNSASGKLDPADTAYYTATSPTFSGVGLPDGQMLASAAASYKNTVAGGVLNAEAGDAYLISGQSDVSAAESYSRGVKPAEGEEPVKPADPSVNFTAAFDAYQAATACSDPEVRARAFYGMGVAQELLASVAADDAAVDAALAKAKEAYAKVAEASSTSPYCGPATRALGKLDSALTVDYYKSAANAFVNLPEPSKESILSEGADSLTPGEKVDVKDFETNDDSEEEALPVDEPISADAADAAPAEEAAAPAEEAAAPAEGE